MKLSERTIKLLKNFSTINNQMIFYEGNEIKTVSQSSTVKAVATIKETIEMEFGIYEMNKFLSVLSLFDDPEIELQNNYLNISSDNRKIKYTYSSPSIIRNDAKKNLPPLDELVSFTLTSATLNDTMKAISVLKLPEIAIIGDGQKLSITGLNTANPSSDIYENVIGETDQEFRSIFNIENLKLINDPEFEVSINSRYAIFTGSDVKYYVIVES